MMVSTRGRYALRLMLDLAERCERDCVPMKEIVERQGISKKYMEQIMPTLSKAGLVESIHGANGGYRLTKAPTEYSVWEIISLTDGSLAPVACLSEGAIPCARASECKTLAMWERFNAITKDYFSSITLADLSSGNI